MQGRVLANYCKTDSAMTREQKRIEQELADFEQNIWGKETPKDSLTLAAEQQEKDAKSSRRSKKSSDKESRRSKASSAAAAKQPKSSSGAPRASARRQRR